MTPGPPPLPVVVPITCAVAARAPAACAAFVASADFPDCGVAAPLEDTATTPVSPRPAVRTMPATILVFFILSATPVDGQPAAVAPGRADCVSQIG